MSRSYRAPVYTQGYKGRARKQSKRSATRAVRAADNVPSGAAYKREYNSWDIVDWKIPAPNDRKAGRK